MANLPNEFSYKQSTQQAFYFFNIVTIGGEDIEADDWVGAFNMGYCSNPVATTEDICGLLGAVWNPEEICVGARRWGVCGGGVCDVPVMGDNGSEVTVGYMNPGDFPTFKIYDASENTYYDAIPSADISWTNMELFTLNNLNA